MVNVPPRFPDTPTGKDPQRFHVQAHKGVNKTVPRASIGDTQYAWLENFMPKAPGNARAMWAEGSAIFTASGALTIVNAFFYNLGAMPFAAIFLSDGSAVQVSAQGGNQLTIAPAGLFYNGSYIPVAAQWNANGIVIVSEATDPNGFFAWDGATLYSVGLAAPGWLTNNTATTMPSGVHGNWIEVYQNRAWIVTPPSGSGASGVAATFTNSAPSNGADFTTTDGAGTTPQQDSSLRYQFNVMKQSNGFLYLFGDSNTATISNVQTGGSPTITTFSNQNLDPQIGCAFPLTAQLFGQAVVFTNAEGVFILNGGIVQKISDDIDDLFLNADFSVTPSAAVAIIFDVKCYVLLLRTLDQNMNSRNLLLVWNGRDWFVASQINTLTQVFSQEFNSILTCYGTNGKSIWPLFQSPNSSLQKIWKSKLFAGGQNDDGWIKYKKTYRFYWQIDDYSGAGVSISGTVDAETDTTSQSTSISQNSAPRFFNFTNNSGQVIQFSPTAGGAIQWGVAGFSLSGIDAPCNGLLLGTTMSLTGSDFSLISHGLLYSEDAPFLG
jgi:hypothetical protein